MTLQEQQMPIDGQLISALIEATPETRNAAALHVARSDDGGNEKMEVEIVSPEGKEIRSAPRTRFMKLCMPFQIAFVPTASFGKSRSMLRRWMPIRHGDIKPLSNIAYCEALDAFPARDWQSRTKLN